MVSSIRNSAMYVVLAIFLVTLPFGCKSKKKAMEASASKDKAKMEEANAALRKQEEEARRKEAEMKEREAAERLRNEAAAKESAPAVKLSQYFQSIASSTSVASANNSITEALTLFSSPDAPVLIVISEEDGKKDYDRPTTIKEYLNYLKDQKKNMNSISTLKTDGSGKITELELRKPL